MRLFFSSLLFLFSLFCAGELNTLEYNIQETRDSIKRWESQRVLNPTSSVENALNDRIQGQVDALNSTLRKLESEKEQHLRQHNTDIVSDFTPSHEPPRAAGASPPITPPTQPVSNQQQLANTQSKGADLLLPLITLFI